MWKSRIVTFNTYNPISEFDFFLRVVSPHACEDTYSIEPELGFCVAKGLEVVRVDLKQRKTKSLLYAYLRVVMNRR